MSLKPVPTSAEMDILSVVWSKGPSTVREVHEALQKSSGYTTTLKQMQLMVEKGLLLRNERFRSHLYSPATPKEQLQSQIAGDVLSRAFGGSLTNLLLGALSAKPVSRRELADIRILLDEFKTREGK